MVSKSKVHGTQWVPRDIPRDTSRETPHEQMIGCKRGRNCVRNDRYSV